MKSDFLNTVKAKVIILTWYVETHETMAINKFQRSRLTFALSAKVAHIVVPSIYQNIVFSQTIGPIELKFHVKTPYDKSVKIYTKYFGHMTKMAATPIYGKKTFKNLLLQNQKASDLETWYVALRMWVLSSLFKWCF